MEANTLSAWIAVGQAVLAGHITELLARGGYQPAPFPDSLATADARATAAPDLIVVDGIGPGRAGSVCYARARQDGRTKDVPVLSLGPVPWDDPTVSLDPALDAVSDPLNGAELLFRADRLTQRRSRSAPATVQHLPPCHLCDMCVGGAGCQSALHQLFEAMLEGFALHEIILGPDSQPVDYRFLYVNKKFETFTGLDRAAVLNRTVTDVLPGIEREWIERYGRVALSGEALTFTSFTSNLNKHFQVTAYSPRRGIFATVFEDVTDQMRKERALIQAEQEWAWTFDAVPDLITVLDENHRIVRMNKAMTEKLQLSGQSCASESCSGLPCYQVVHGLDSPPDYCPHTKLFMDKDIRQAGPLEVSEPLLGGTFLVTVSPIRGENGAVRGSVHIARDITERRQMELELQAAKSAAEAANQAKSEMLAAISHDIRNPLNAVLGIAQILLESRLLPEQRRWASLVLSSGAQMLALLNDILDMSKLGAGKMEIGNVAVDLPACVRETMDLLSALALAKDIALVCDIAPDTPRLIAADPLRLRRILVNLLSNAVKFTDQGEVRCSVRLLPADGQPPALQITVRDTGTGIAPDEIPRLFQPFHQVANGGTAIHTGTGLGLAISKSLAELMGGHMWAESTGVPGQGAAFHFTLPAADPAPSWLEEAPPAPVEPRTEQHRAPAGDHGFALRHPLRILLVEDDPINRMVMEQLLEKLGYCPGTCANGQEALAALAGQDYDLVLLDLVMPVMDGLETARRIRADLPPSRRPCIAALTAMTKGELDAECALPIFDVHLTKPLDPNDLRRLLQTVPPLAADGGTLPTPLRDAGKRSPTSPPPDTNTVPLLDHMLLDELRTTMGAGFAAFLGQVVDETASRFIELRAALARGDAVQTRFAAHTMRGGCEVAGLRRLSRLLARIEQMALAGQMAAASGLLAEIADGIDESRRALAAESRMYNNQ